MTRFLLVSILIFGIITVVGLAFFLMWAAGSHGDFKFRSNMAQDWVAFGLPLIGFVGISISYLLLTAKGK